MWKKWKLVKIGIEGNRGRDEEWRRGSGVFWNIYDELGGEEQGRIVGDVHLGDWHPSATSRAGTEQSTGQ